MAEQESHFYAFGRFRLKTAERVLLREGEPVPLTPKVFDILLTLVEKGGHVVEKDDLMKRVWPSTFVEEGNLHTVMTKARHGGTIRRNRPCRKVWCHDRQFGLGYRQR